METKQTTVRFADEVYTRLELASARTGLPINSIVVIACLTWLEEHRHWYRQGRSERSASEQPAPDDPDELP